MNHHDKKAGITFLWIGILVTIALSLVLYLEVREPRVEELRESQSLQESSIRVLSEAPIRGSSEQNLTIIEFGDFECEFCLSVKPLIEKSLETYEGQIQHMWIHVLNPEHEESESAAIASICAQEQGQFWEYHDLLFKNSYQLNPVTYNRIASSLDLDLQQFQDCLGRSDTRRLVRENDQFARTQGVDSTPYLLIGDRQISGSFSQEELDAAIQSSLDAS